MKNHPFKLSGKCIGLNSIGCNYSRLKQYLISISILLFTAFVFAHRLSAQIKSIPFFNEPFSVSYEEKIAGQFDAGISDYFTRYTHKITDLRGGYWSRDLSSVINYNLSIEKNRGHLKKILGIDRFDRPVYMYSDNSLEKVWKPNNSKVAETPYVSIYKVKWTVTADGLEAEGLLLMPKGVIRTSIVIIPDADETPEQYAGISAGPGTAMALAEGGARVLIPVLISRTTKYSGSNNLYPLKRPWFTGYQPVDTLWTNEPAREWIWRQSFVMGKSVIGMEVLKIMAAIDWFIEHPAGKRIGVMGYEEGGLIALYTAALDTRIDAVWVSGYFGPREELWKEPVSRNLWGLLNEFGDAEIGSMIVPRKLIIEAAPVKPMNFPLTPVGNQRDYGLKGELKTPSEEDVANEVERLRRLFPKDSRVQSDITLIKNVGTHGSDRALKIFATELDITVKKYGKILIKPYVNPDPENRQRRVFDNMQSYIQNMIPEASHKREAFMPGDYSSIKAFESSVDKYRDYFYNEIIGKIDEPLLPMNVKSRKVYDEPEWTGYEVALDVWPGVYAWGILAVPKGIKKGESRPAVVMQHGNGGLPTTSLLVDHYHGVLKELAKKGFVAFSPYNSYFFNIRKAQAVKANAFSVIIPQYQQILNYLKSLDYVDSNRIALYGKSWGGWTALNVPAVLKDFKASVCVGFYNDWLNKTVSNKYHISYFYENSLCIYNWNVGNTMLHAELGKLIFPRPFMVVAGLHDAVARPEDVASEFEKVKLVYRLLGIDEKAEVDFWPGKHEIDLENGGIPFLVKNLMNEK